MITAHDKVLLNLFKKLLKAEYTTVSARSLYVRTPMPIGISAEEEQVLRKEMTKGGDDTD